MGGERREQEEEEAARRGQWPLGEFPDHNIEQGASPHGSSGGGLVLEHCRSRACELSACQRARCLAVFGRLSRERFNRVREEEEVESTEFGFGTAKMPRLPPAVRT